MKIDILGIKELKWAGIGEFNSDGLYLVEYTYYMWWNIYCGIYIA